MATPKNVEVNKLVKCIEESQFGFSSVLEGPFGIKRGRNFYTISLLHVLQLNAIQVTIVIVYTDIL